MKHVLTLALDLAYEVSWATRVRDGGVMHATDSFRSKFTESSGPRYLRFRNWLAELRQDARALVIVFKESDARDHRRWLPHLTEYSKLSGVPVRGVSTGAIKRAVTGRGNSSMEAVLAGVEALGYQPGSDGEAMAIALLMLIESEANRQQFELMEGGRNVRTKPLGGGLKNNPAILPG